MLAAIVPGSAKAFKFDEEFKLTADEVSTISYSPVGCAAWTMPGLTLRSRLFRSQSLDVSDHYPVEVQLYSTGKGTWPPFFIAVL